MSGCIAIIPARGGSKRLPRKNIRLLAGKPLMAYSIEAALGCPSVEQTFVSSDDEEIRAAAAGLGADVIDRPRELAADHVRNNDVVAHVLDTLLARGQTVDRVVLLQPTSPLRTAQHLEECLTAFVASAAVSAVSVCSTEYHPASMLTIRDGLAVPYGGARDVETRRDELPAVYRQNGAIYAVSHDAFRASGRFVVSPCFPYIMSRHASIDVDDALDFELASLLLKQPSSP